jgi:hypothetical protein
MDDTAEDSPRRQFERFKQTLLRAREEQVAEWTSLDGSFRELVERRRWRGRPPVEPADPPRSRDSAQQRFQQTVEAARVHQGVVESQKIPRLFVGYLPVFLGTAIAVAVFAPLWMLVDPRVIAPQAARDSAQWVGIAGIASVCIAILLLTVIYTLGAFQFSDGMRRLQQLVAEAGWIHKIWLGFAKDDLQKQQEQFEVKQAAIERQRQETLGKYDTARSERQSEIEARRAKSVFDARQTLNQKLRAFNDEKTEHTRLIAAEHARRIEESQSLYTERIEQAANRLAEYRNEREQQQREFQNRIVSDWQRGQSEFARALNAAYSTGIELFPAWSRIDSPSWRPGGEIPPGIPVGRCVIDLTRIEGAVADDDRLLLTETEFTVPMIAPFPTSPSVLITTDTPASRDKASRIMQATILRWLTSLPAGKLRLTILDPAGLGEAFSGFMHLADHDELLINSRIWTEANHIEARLADLTQHMENVLQTYLRNEFATIEAYNEYAGEVAEPYHLLVVAGFPHKFSEMAAKRLASIVQSGPKCGVYTLIQWDQSQPLPHAMRREDLEQNAMILEGRKGVFHLRGQQRLSMWPIEPEAIPAPEVFTRIVRRMGEEAKHARRVEVSFGRIAPHKERYWSLDSRRGIDIPLGRAGATKLQHLRLGKGTSQHMLIAGKTGSGKSTFLHALITNLSLHYSPQEINFFLIDFKKGVEFKDYAALELPHARVIAIESDREFGVSALQRLDEVLQERGELFRREGVQDIGSYRDRNPEAVLPRIMLVIDEFQEFFVEDDRVSQSAALLLDRLIRQGRAFGVHVVLGSQTLAGAYTLARSTLGQVAVRVALQCSEADAHLILSEENTAARLLTRPGEAIYNDANGLVEGNHPFQVAWLPDNEREQYLLELRSLARTHNLQTAPAIVFEGNVASDPANNPRLVELIASGAGEKAPVPVIWLGEAVEIRPPTAIRFEQQAGSNLLLVGSNSDEALGVMSTALLTLTASHPAADRRSTPIVPCTLFDGSQRGSWEDEHWTAVTDLLNGSTQRLRPGQEDIVLAEWINELNRRDADRARRHPDRFLFIYNLSRFRELRKADDDYGLGAFGAADQPAASPAKQFSEILSKGPVLGMHVICWCDSGANVERWFSRHTLKEFELRICFQMNASDSSNLIDSPAAAKLGTHRAILYRESEGSIEKFRPYRPPPAEWMKGLWNERSKGDIEEATDLDSFALL